MFDLHVQVARSRISKQQPKQIKKLPPPLPSVHNEPIKDINIHGMNTRLNKYYTPSITQ